MRRLLRLVPFAVVVVIVGLAVGLPQAGAITNGTADTTHTNVGLLYPNDTPALSLGLCSGTLIAPDKLLVAAHCTAGFGAFLNLDEISVSFDQSYSLTDEGVITTAHPIAVTGLSTHPDYRGWPYTPSGPMVNDVGVVQLAHPVTGVPLAELPGVGFLDEQAAHGGLQGHEFINVGYGINGLDRSFSSPQVNITWDLQREVSSTRFMSLTPKNLNQHGGVSLGDSGGPHFFGGNHPNLEVAVTSTGAAGATSDNEVESAQRLDTKSVHDWLQEMLAHN